MAEPVSKKAKSTGDEIKDFKNFKISRVLSENSDRKTMCVEGRFNDDQANSAVIVLEKMPFEESKLSNLLQSSSLRTEFRNDIYGKYECMPDPSVNSVKANLIYPATEKHIAKYSSSEIFVVDETPALYAVRSLMLTSQFPLNFFYPGY